MKIENLSVTNFRGIRQINLTSLGSMVIIAGQNGSGKSCIFDAIRLLKSVYGGYQANEWQQWMGEFQIALSNRSDDYKSMFNDPSRELRIVCDFKLSDDERAFITSNALDLLKDMIWRRELPDAYSWGGYRMAMFNAQFRDKEPAVSKTAQDMLEPLMKELASPCIKAECFIPAGGVLQLINCVTLSMIFTTYRPEDIGVIDYHGAQRHYGRESVKGVNLNLENNEQQKSQHALYNYAAKYNNVKGEMAGAFVREILSEKAGVPKHEVSSLSATLSELFTTFFPEKEFLGPQPTANGALTFPVKTADGHIHDLDELSSGEKEILYGYLRIRNSAPKNSIIILDEPELHLNPRLIRGLPQFYRKNLGNALGNQIWLVTHSDALLREVVGKDGYNVFHMLPCGSLGEGDVQLRPLKANADLDIALVNMVGDLAAYRPGGKVVIFEGGGDSDFDRKVVGTLFPELQARANLISGTNKTRVRALHETLELASKEGSLPFKFYAITDRDSSDEIPSSSIGIFSWDSYHIENYFMEAPYIRMVLRSIGASNVLSEEQILDELRNCAIETLPQLIRHGLNEHANSLLTRTINTGTDPRKGDLVREIHEAVIRSSERFSEVIKEKLSMEKIAEIEKNIRSELETSLADGSWVKNFRGRDILKRFSGKWAHSTSYDVFRNLIMSKMQDEGFEPPGMKFVVQKILEQ